MSTQPPPDQPAQPILSYARPRTESQQAADAEAATVQSGALAAAPGLSPEVLELLARRRGDGLPAQDDGTPESPPIEVVPADGPDEREVVVARGEVLIRLDAPPGSAAPLRSDPGAAERFLQDLGYDRILGRTEQAVASGIWRYRSGRGLADRRSDIDRLRQEFSISAGYHLVVPLGHVIKGDDYPVPTALVTFDSEWETSFEGTTPVQVAVIDTGITGEQRTDGWLSAISRDRVVDPLDMFPLPGGDHRLDLGAGHGTFTSGVIQQTAPACAVRMYRAADSDGMCSEIELASAMVRAADNGALIINVSMGMTTVDDLPPRALEWAIERITRDHPDTLVVASAGNEGLSRPMWPAAFKQVVAVGALRDDLEPVPWSQHGFWLDCSTIGVGIASTFVEGTSPSVPSSLHPDSQFGPDAWALWSGTSFAAPQVTGALAALCQASPGRTPRAALQRLLAGQPHRPGYGRLIRLLPGTPIA